MYSGSYFLGEQAMRGEGVSRGWRAAGAPTPGSLRAPSPSHGEKRLVDRKMRMLALRPAPLWWV